MTREEATAIAYGDREMIIEVLLQLSARIEELQRKVALLTRDSSNSSKPPSSDGPASKPKMRRRKKSRHRKPGGQPGHQGANRDLVPIEKVDSILEVLPKSCEICHTPLHPGEDGSRMLGNYIRCQVIEIPDIKPYISEYKLRCVKCDCGAVTWATVPPQARSAFGHRLTALLAYLTAVHRVTRRGCQEFARTLLGIDISLGSVCKLHEEVSEALKPCCEEIKQALPKQDILNVDETGWKSMGKGIWLWVFVAPAMTFFTLAASRGAKVLKGVLGEVFSGVICSDMFSAYNAYHKGGRQICWAHIIRTLRGLKHACRSPDGVRSARWMLAEIGRLFALWHAFKDEHVDRQTLVKKSVPIRARMNRCLQAYELSEDADVARTARSLLKHWNHLFTFLDHEHVEPTNNSAERGIRPAVQWRKICFGNQSEKGELLTARLLTVTRTCVMQRRNTFDFLVQSEHIGKGSVILHSSAPPGERIPFFTLFPACRIHRSLFTAFSCLWLTQRIPRCCYSGCQ
jgi:transposase